MKQNKRMSRQHNLIATPSSSGGPSAAQERQPGPSKEGCHSLNIPCLKEFSIQDDDWEIYEERLEQYFIVNAVEESRKVAVLIASMGNEAYAYLKDLCYPEKPKEKTFKEICEIMSRQFKKCVSIFRKRLEFHKLAQTLNEDVTEWYAKIKKKVSGCAYGNNIELMLKDKFVCGMRSGGVLNRLCEEDPNENSLQTLYEVALKRESALKHQSNLDQDDSILLLKDKRKVKEYSQSFKSKFDKCKCCGKTNHAYVNCRFKNYSCHKCKRVGHLANVCLEKVDQNELEESEVDMGVVEMLTVDQVHFLDAIIIKVEIAGTPIDMILDTGAGVTVLPLSVYQKNFSGLRLEQTDIKLRAFGEGIVYPKGRAYCQVKWGDKKRNCSFLVVPNVSKALLGRDWLDKFGVNFTNLFALSVVNYDGSLLKNLLNEFKELFGDKLGCYKHEKIKLYLQDGAKPKFYKPRPIPFAFKEQVDEQLDKLEQSGIIERVASSVWGTPLVPVMKPNGQIRICANYKLTVNKYLNDVTHPLPRIEELLTALQGGERFSKLDFKQAYNQLELDDETQSMLAWSTHKGIYRMKRLPFGTKPAVAIFQKIIEKCLLGLPGVGCFLDDVIVTGKDFKDHMANLKMVFTKLRECGFVLNKEKCEFFKEEVSYLGHIINSKGLRKDPKKTEALQNMRVPRNVSELKAFLGAVNYYGRFVNNFAQMLSPLYELLQKNKRYKWSKKCNKAFEQIKEAMLSENILVHYNPQLPIKVYCDASKDGVGGVLMHEMTDGVERPISFASRTLSKSEKKYSMIHKEALAIYWTLKKFYQYLMGREFQIFCDHKPLLALFGENKGVPEMAAGRLQRWAIFISGFNYTLHYVKGDGNKADGFSRLPLPVTCQEESEVSEYVNMVEGILDVDLERIKVRTQVDKELQAICMFCMNGWPEKLPKELGSFETRRNEIYVEDGVLMWGHRIIIPQVFRRRLIKELHASHQGMSRMKARARSYFWWPKLDSDIEKYVKSCEACMSVRSSPKHEQVKSWPEVKNPFERIHIDFLGPLRGKMFLLVTDAYSKWPEVFFMNKTHTEATVGKLREVFSRFGLPKVLVSDNGSQFTSEEFKKFCEQNNILHMRSPPYHPQSNGAAERGVRSFKEGILKYLNDGEARSVDVDTAVKRYLFHYRTSIHSVTGETPARRMLGREVRTRLDVLKKSFTEGKEREASTERKIKKQFQKGEKVYSRIYNQGKEDRRWILAEVMDSVGSRLYRVKECDSGRVYNRHVDQLLKTTQGEDDGPS